MFEKKKNPCASTSLARCILEGSMASPFVGFAIG